jgi:hypothetical protein
MTLMKRGMEYLFVSETAYCVLSMLSAFQCACVRACFCVCVREGWVGLDWIGGHPNLARNKTLPSMISLVHSLVQNKATSDDIALIVD